MKKLPLFFLALLFISCLNEPVIGYNWEITRYVDCTSVPSNIRFPKIDSFKCFHYGLLEGEVIMFVKSMKMESSININDTSYIVKQSGNYKKLK